MKLFPISSLSRYGYMSYRVLIYANCPNTGDDILLFKYLYIPKYKKRMNKNIFHFCALKVIGNNQEQVAHEPYRSTLV